MKSTRLSHTTKDGKAQCLNYRNGKRCGRKATALVNYKSANGTPGFQPRCSECSGCSDVDFYTTSADGYTVTTNVFDTMQQRQYIPVGTPGYAVDVDKRID